MPVGVRQAAPWLFIFVVMPLERKDELPPKYYFDHFNYLLGYIEQHYAPCLAQTEHDFIAQFRALPEPAALLFLRMTNRKGHFFETAGLRYEEIPDIEAAGYELQAQGFARPPALPDEAYGWFMLNTLKKGVLYKLFKPLLEAPAAASAYKKPDLIDIILNEVPFEQVVSTVNAAVPLLKVEHQETALYLRFLFFGTLEADMTPFVIRDLGVRQYEEVAAENIKPRFANRREARDAFQMLLLYHEFRLLRGVLDAEALFKWFEGWKGYLPHLQNSAQATKNRLMLRLGQWFEKAQSPALALEAYSHTQQPPARERRVRLFTQLGLLMQAEQVLEAIKKAPLNADEQQFALDFDPAKKRARKSTSLHLKQADYVEIERHEGRPVEVDVLLHYRRQGVEGLRSENYLWRALFGLLYWDIVFDAQDGTMHNPMQVAPSDLYMPAFFERRKARLEERNALLHQPEAFMAYCQELIDQKYGTTNPFVGWHDDLLPLINTVYQRVAPAPLGNTLLTMAANLKSNTTGFPDLFIYTETGYSFVEVKSPNDQLSNQQLFWLRYFAQQGIEAKVLRVGW